jgi:putative hemolysin
MEYHTSPGLGMVAEKGRCTMSLLGQISIILLLVLANGLFSMSEMAVVSSRKVRLQQHAEEGRRGATMAYELANNPNRFLSTVQIGITLIGILAGALGGATVATRIGAYLAQISWLAPYSEAIAVALVVLGTTYLSLVIGELAPKRLALNDPERIAMAVSGLMRSLSVVASPAVRLLSASTDLILRILGVKPSLEPPVTEEEIKVLLEQGTEAGVFEAAEQDLVESVFTLGDRRASALMTPRHEVAWLDVEDPPEVLERKIVDCPYSRFPVAQGSLDNVLGEVDAKDLLARSLAGEPFNLRAMVRKPLYVPEIMPALKVLEVFKQSGTQMAMVLDEYGSIQGLVTLTDILEAIVGDIPSAEELAEPPVVQREDGSWLLDGMLPVDEFKELFQLEDLPGEEQGLYQTLGGFVMSQIGRIPTAADHFEWLGLRFEILDMDGPRVDKVLVIPVYGVTSDIDKETD